jgi:hypothetical protein
LTRGSNPGRLDSDLTINLLRYGTAYTFRPMDKYVRLEVLTVVARKNSVVWDIAAWLL